MFISQWRAVSKIYDGQDILREGPVEKCFREKLEKDALILPSASPHILSIQRRVFGKAESQVTTGIE